MISKRAIQYLAVFLVALIVIPHFVKATTYETITEQVNIPAYGENDEDWNVMNETSRSNLDTWNPQPEGVFVGSLIPESLFQANEIAGVDSYLYLMNEMTFSSLYMMSGVSKFVVRMPIYTENSSWNTSHLKIYAIDDDTTYTITYGGAFPYLNFTGNSQMIFTYAMDSQDDEITTDYDCHYTKDHRTYVIVNAPIVPNQLYLFVGRYDYYQDSDFKWYYSPSDIASDYKNESTFCICYKNAPDDVYINQQTFDVDMGWSFIFQEGLSGGIGGFDRYFYEGDEISFLTFIPDSNVFTNKALSIMIPFFTNDNNTLNVTVIVEDYGGTERLNVTNEYHDFILNSSSIFSMNEVGALAYYYKWWTITIKFNENKRVKFCMFDVDDIHQPHAFTDHSNANYNEAERFQIITTSAGGSYYIIYRFVFQHSLMIDDYQWSQVPIMNKMTSLNIYGVEVQSGSFFDRLLISLYFTVDLVATLWIPAYTLYKIHSWLYDNWGTYKDFWDTAGTYAKSLIDSIVGFGKWLWKIGEMLWGMIQWVVEQIIHYGSILLAIVITGLAAIVPMLIWGFEALMLTFFLKLAQGKPEEAGALAARVGGMISGAAGKMRLR